MKGDKKKFELCSSDKCQVFTLQVRMLLFIIVISEIIKLSLLCLIHRLIPLSNVHVLLLDCVVSMSVSVTYL